MPRHRKPVRRLLAGLIVFVLAILAWITAHRYEAAENLPTGARSSTAPTGGGSARAKLSARIDEALAATDQRTREASSRRLGTARQAIRSACAAARSGADSAVSDLCSAKGSAQLAWLMAKDRLCQTAEAEAQINASLEPRIIKPCLRGMAAAESELGMLQAELAEASTALAVELAALTGESPATAGLDRKTWEALCRDLNASIPKVKQIVLTQCSAALGLGISAVFVRSTLQAASGVLGHIVERFVATQGVALASAVADGPLPFGDAIGLVFDIVGTGLCAYDLHKARNELLPALRTSLVQAVNRAEGNSVGQVEARVGAMLKAVQQHNHATVAKLKESL
jgi:hypothetical protein